MLNNHSTANRYLSDSSRGHRGDAPVSLVLISLGITPNVPLVGR